MRLTFVGTGASCSIPVIGHLNTSCACRDAIANPDGPNCRNNVAMLLSLPFSKGACSDSVANSDFVEKEDNVEWHHVLIDCGKTFRSAYLRVLAPLRVRCVDALLLTHGHADAMQCVEELCGMQAEAARAINEAAASSRTAPRQATAENHNAGDAAVDEIARKLRRVPTYLTYPTLEQIEMVSRDLVRSSFHIGAAPSSRSLFVQAMRETADAVSSFAAETSVFNAPTKAMDLFFLDEERPRRIYVPIDPSDDASSCGTAAEPPTSGTSSLSTSAAAGLPFYSFPVEHGPHYVSMGFVFGRGTAFTSQLRKSPMQAAPPGSCVVYISDVSAIPPTSLTFLLDLVHIDVLVLDLLAEHGCSSASHYCADDSMPMVVQLAPRRVYFVGMFCSLEHHSTNTQLVQELAEMKAQVREELNGGAGALGTCSPEEAVQRARKQRFLEETVSMELAFDGQQLDIDT